MPLSEQEQRLLEEMERSLYHNDADFVAGGSGRHGRPTYAMIVTGVLIGVVGIATLIAGVGLRVPIVGVIGFVLMFAGVLLALTPPRNGQASRSTPSAGAKPGTAGGSFLKNLGERWDNRPDDKEE
jgi:predicted phage tail protein